MTRKQKKDMIIGIGGGLMVSIIVIYFFANYLLKRKNTKLMISSPKKYSGCNTSINNHSTNFPLKKGSTGIEVKKLQEWLNQKGEKLCVDGDWGNKTENAYQKYKSIFWNSNEISVTAYMSIIS